MNTKSSKTKKELKTGIFLSYFLIAVNVVSGFLLVPFIIKNIGQSDYGLYTAASSLITMFIVDLGLGTAVTKFVSKYRVTSSQEEINKVISVVFACFFVLAIILVAIFSITFIFLENIYSSFTLEEIKSFKIVYIIVASYSVLTFPFSISNGVLIAYDKIFLSKTADLISKFVFIVLTILVLLFNWGLYLLTACYAVHGIVGVFLKLLFVKIKTPAHFFTRMNWYEFKKAFKEVIVFSLWAAINTFGRVILVSFAPTILGFASPSSTGTKEIAIFSIAVQIESYVSLFATAFGSIFYPSISRILFVDSNDYKQSLEQFQKFHIRIARIQIAILFLVILGLIVCGKEFLQLWVGTGYEKSYYCILAICVPALFFYPLQTAENAMAAIEKIKYCAISTIISVIIGIGASIGLAFAFGSIGVSIGICVGFILRTILFNLFFKKYLRLQPFVFYFKSYFSFIAPAVLTIASALILNHLFPNPSWIVFALKVMIITAIYLVLMCIFGLDRDEKNKIDGIIVGLYKKISNFAKRVER